MAAPGALTWRVTLLMLVHVASVMLLHASSGGADKLEPVQNLTVHSVGTNWFALKWAMPSRTCPKDVKYSITYNDRRTQLHEWTGGHDYPLCLNTGEQYVIIMDAVYPNTTYFVMVALIADQVRSEYEKVEVTTLPGPAPPILKESPKILNRTNSSLDVSVTSTDCPHDCSATWQYKTLYETTWNVAGKVPVNETMEIAGLNSSTLYQVRALLQRYTECQPFESNDVPITETPTLPDLLPIVPDHSPDVTSATNTSLTVVTDCSEECTRGYIAHWDYKAAANSTWNYAGHEEAHRPMTIENLVPDAEYEIRFNLQWPTGPRNLSAFSEVLRAETCSNTLEAVRYLWEQSKYYDSITLQWSRHTPECRRNFFVRWKAYETEKEGEFPPESFDSNKCPYNATLLARNASENCTFPEYYYCFTPNENLTPGRRYVIEVTSTDGNGKCSEPYVHRTTTPFRLWGGISVGHWSLIIVVMLLLFASVPACIALKKRFASKIWTRTDVAFSTSSLDVSGTTGDANGEADRYTIPEPSTRILDRRFE